MKVKNRLLYLYYCGSDGYRREIKLSILTALAGSKQRDAAP